MAGFHGILRRIFAFLPLFVSGDPLNKTGYASKEYDQAVLKAKVEHDPKIAMGLMREAENILMKDYPFLPLYYRSTNLMMKPYVKGWFLTPTGSLYFRDATIEK